MQKAFTLVQQKFDFIIPLGCLAHTLHLLCNDILKCKSAGTFMATVVDIVKTIKNTQVLNALLEKIKSERNCNVSLKFPCKIRWGSYLQCLESLLDCKDSHQILSFHGEAKATLTKKMKTRLLDEAVFWVRVEQISNISKPIVSWITILESNDCNIHKVYKAFSEIENKLVDLLPQSSLSASEESCILVKLKSRKANSIRTIHYAATLLDPSTQGHFLTKEEQVDGMEFIHSLCVNMKADVVNVMKDLANYRSKEDLWGKKFIWISVETMNPVTWWRGLCGTTALSKVAVRILTAPVTSTATERSFSTFSWIHSKKRNRLTTSRAGKITYLSHNWKLMQKQNSSQGQQDNQRKYSKDVSLSEVPACSSSMQVVHAENRSFKRKLSSSSSNDEDETDSEACEEVTYVESDNETSENE
ncbi:uncharacterized protein LOC134530835 [Bacillus rossius redtenbacheri]|uniref:uncharacterized protein LOC134530835 n=1 Tax=Bacillus rossius redtenbacheri TaxID=93214 RepID=UPI002FDEB3AC